MAKKQSFGDKTKKQSKKSKTYLKIVRISKAKETGGIRFNEEMVGVPPDDNIDNYVKNYLDKAKKK